MYIHGPLILVSQNTMPTGLINTCSSFQSVSMDEFDSLSITWLDALNKEKFIPNLYVIRVFHDGQVQPSPLNLWYIDIQ